MNCNPALTSPTPTPRSLAAVSSEVFALILAHLALPDILNVSRTCKRWHHASSDSAVWRRLFLRHFTVDLHHQPPPLLVANAFSTAHGCRAGPAVQADASFMSNTIQWKNMFRLQHCWAKGRCSRKTIMNAVDSNRDLCDPETRPESGGDKAQIARDGTVVTSFLAVDHLVFLGKRNGDIAVASTRPTHSTSSSPPAFSTRLDPPAPILCLFHLGHESPHDGDRQFSTIVALTPKRIHRFSLNLMTGSLSFITSVKHTLLSSARSPPLKLLSLPTIKGCFVDESTLVVLVAPVPSPSSIAPPSTVNQSSPACAPTLCNIDPTTGALSHVMTRIAAPCACPAFDLFANLSRDRSHLTVLLSMPAQLYTPPGSLEHHELRLQTIHFQRSLLSSPSRWHYVDSHVALPTWTPNSLWPSPLSQNGIPLSPPTHHSPITAIRIAHDLIMSSPTAPLAASSFALRYLVAAHRDHSVSLYALVPSSSSGGLRLYFLGALPDQVHSAILDLTIAASIGRVVALCRDGKARVWQLEPWLPVVGLDVCVDAGAAGGGAPVVNYDVLFHRPALSYTRKPRYSMLHLSNKTAAKTRVPVTPAEEEEAPEGHYHQGIAGRWLAVDEGDDGHGSGEASRQGARSRRSAWQQKRVRTDALVAEIPIVLQDPCGEAGLGVGVGRAWVHVARDQLVCGLQNQIVSLNFAE